MAIDSFGPEVTLERGHDLQRVRIVVAIGLDPIPILAQRFLQRDHGVSLRARRKNLFKIHDRRRFHPMADTRFIESMPGKLFARVLLAGGRYVGMSQNTHRRDAVASLNAAAERGHGGDLAGGKIRIAVVMTGIGDFNSDRTRIDVGFSRPFRFSGVPGPAAFRHHLDDAAVLEYEAETLLPCVHNSASAASASAIPV